METQIILSAERDTSSDPSCARLRASASVARAAEVMRGCANRRHSRPEPRVSDLEVDSRRSGAHGDVETRVQPELSRKFVAKPDAAAADALTRGRSVALEVRRTGARERNDAD